MLFCIDIGNTNIVLGLADKKKVLKSWRIRTERNMTTDELAVLAGTLFRSANIKKDRIRDIIICSVVPRLLDTFEKFCKIYFDIKPLIVGPTINLGMPVLYDNPKEVGADRIVNAVGAYEKYPTALIVVDLGTATTFDYVSQEGSYIGGAIAPGMIISSEALFLKTSKLPRVEIFSRPKSVIARDTLNSINVGVVYGHAGLVDGIVNRMKKESREKVTVVATGGLAPLVFDVSETIDHLEESLTLEGLMIIFGKNK